MKRRKKLEKNKCKNCEYAKFVYENEKKGKETKVYCLFFSCIKNER